MLIRLTLLFLLFAQFLFSQNEDKPIWLKKLDSWNVKPSVDLQMWATYTDGMELFDNSSGKYVSVDDRLNFTLHRSRYGLSAQPYERLKFNVTVAMDFVGRDALSSLDAGQNNGPNPVVRLWQTTAQWKMTEAASSPHLTFGYFAPRVGRESMINPIRVTSMEKAWSQNYLRRHLVGTGPGRAVGLNLGGQYYKEGNTLSFRYDLGMFTPVYHDFNGNSMGEKASPLITGRGVLMIGDPESATYTMGHKVNYFGKRNGFSIAAAGSSQGSTSLFENSYTLGGDFLLNLGQLNVDGEWHVFTRSIDGDMEASANSGYLRMSYNLHTNKGHVIEPMAMLVQYNGEMESEGQAIAGAVGMPAGEDQHIDIGFNYYFNPDLKLTAHYTLRTGDDGDEPDGSTINNYFVSGAGAVRFGNWLGLGLSAKF